MNEKNKCKLKDYFEYNRKNRISIIRVVSLVLFGLIIFNMIESILEIKNMQSYIVGNSNSHEILINSKKELETAENANNIKKINMGNIRKIFEVVGVENIDSLHVDQTSANVVGKAEDMKIIEKLMKNKILNGAHVKRIEGGKIYRFEINAGDSL